MGQNYLPTTDADLLAWSGHFNSLINATATAYGLTAAQAAAYTAAQQAYADAYQSAYEPTTRTSPVIERKNLARDELRQMSRAYVRIIQACPLVTDEQRRALKITVPKTPTPNGVPTVAPAVDLLGMNGYTMSVGIHDSDPSNKRGRPAGTAAAWVYTFVGETYPSDPSLWAFQGGTNKSTFDIIFPNTVPAGSQVWVCAAWINTHQQAGPVCRPVSTNIQGGGVTAPSPMKLAA